MMVRCPHDWEEGRAGMRESGKVRCRDSDGGMEAAFTGHAGESVKVYGEIQAICTPPPGC
jgi:hypothetical protein